MTDLQEALDRARRLPDGDGKVAELERLVEHADAAGDESLALATRFELIQAYGDHTERWRMLPAFGWCLAAYDRNPELFDEWDAELLRWYHKWAITTLLSTPRVGREQTLAALDDMERRYLAGGHSLHAVYALRCRIANHFGDDAEAQRWFTRWRTAPRDENSDCEGCDPSRQASQLADWGRYDEALEIAAPVLTGAVGCAEQPEKALSAILVPYLRLGRYEEAAAAHVRAYRRHRHERDAFPFLPNHLMFCALTGHHERGLDLLDEHLPWLERPYDEFSAMEFAAAGALVARLASEAGSTRPVHGETPDALAARLSATARDLAARFDTRNGTDHQSRRIESWLNERPVTSGLELPPDSPGGDATPAAPPPEGLSDLLAPLSTEALVAVLQERGDRYRVDDDGDVVGGWGPATVYFQQVGQDGEVLHARAVADRRFPAGRAAELYEFCNAWNHDKLMPKAYVHETSDGWLLVAGEVSVDLEHGASARQLGVLVNAAIATGVQLAEAVVELP